MSSLFAPLDARRPERARSSAGRERGVALGEGDFLGPMALAPA
ncbi:hypothetical protein PPSIR1_23579 [Plesiocystis pacifica SIR-1]|uniref:Uncharacterized protein n=1 Tax=Plesiocystis pacifica SIR-1 TaxID=391625 RepID=A6G7V8_9BACT|nr:hypothetical protein PPSIR1_23579 [Plesiocystis pacifica SIR-1]